MPAVLAVTLAVGLAVAGCAAGVDPRVRDAQTAFDGQDPSRMRGTSYDQASRLAQEAYRTLRVYVRAYLFWVNREGRIVHAAVRTP